jgi:hypothetical protein
MWLRLFAAIQGLPIGAFTLAVWTIVSLRSRWSCLGRTRNDRNYLL